MVRRAATPLLTSARAQVVVPLPARLRNDPLPALDAADPGQQVLVAGVAVGHQIPSATSPSGCRARPLPWRPGCPPRVTPRDP